MTDPKPIVIIGDPKFSNPFKGVAASPLEGIGQIRNLDILSNPGSVRLNNLLSKASASTVTGAIQWQRTDPVSGKVYAVDINGVVYSATSAGASWAVIGNATGIGGNNSHGTGGGLGVWQDYVFTVGATSLDVYGPLSGSPAWHNNVCPSDLPDRTTGSQPMFKSIDGALYIGSGKYVCKLQLLTSFNWATITADSSGSAQWTQKAITLADNYQVTSIRELGENLMIGTAYANSQTIADIFPYPRSTLTVGIPIPIAESGIKAMYNYGNRLYVLAGFTGKLFVSDTVTAQQVAQIPNYLVPYDSGGGGNYYPDAIMYHKGKIWFAIGGNNTNQGIWSYNPVTKALEMENTISTGNSGGPGNAAVYVFSLQPLGSDTFLATWEDTTTGSPVYGVDVISNTLRYTGYLGYVESPLMKVGEALANRTMPQLEFALTKPLTTGQGVRIKWRKDLTSSFTTLATIDFTNNGAVQAYNISAGTLTGLVFLQVRVELTTGNDNTSPELQSVILHPGK